MILAIVVSLWLSCYWLIRRCRFLDLAKFAAVDFSTENFKSWASLGGFRGVSRNSTFPAWASFIFGNSADVTHRIEYIQWVKAELFNQV